MEMVARDLREWMALLGFRTVDEMVGRSDKLEVDQAAVHWKARGLDLSALLYQPDMPEKVGRKHQIAQHHGLEKSLDRQKLLELCKPALMHGEPVRAALPIRNTNRTVGTILGSELTRRYGAKGLPDGTIELRFNGSAGQSFGAFVPKGIQLILSGDANDYLGKGRSGGKIVVFPPEGSTFVPEESIIIGNVAFYGATSGQAFIYGLAGERFCVRNSGLEAVVGGVGDHGCEYMTGGRVVVLGKTGRNFAAGMSGGIAYVLDESKDFHQRCNLDMVDLEKLEGAEELSEVQHLIWQHAMHTGSRKAWDVVHNWSWKQQQFVKVIPIDYRRMLQSLAQTNDSGLSREEAVMAAFTANIQDAAPVSGK
jgi:glutamate synthase (ferredoxin)